MKTCRIRGLVLASSLAVLLGLGMPPGAATKERECKDSTFPATGQTTAYPADKNGNTNAVVPDDGTVRAGAALRYKGNGNGTITDRNTGLIWEKKSADGGLHDVSKSFRWSSSSTDTIWDWLDAVNAEGGIGFAAKKDWRIPNVKELQSILDYEKSNPNSNPSVSPAFNNGCVAGATVFTGSCTAGSYYWSSTTYAFFPGYAWFADFGTGVVHISDKSFYSYFVRAVRGGCVD